MNSNVMISKREYTFLNFICMMSIVISIVCISTTNSIFIALKALQTSIIHHSPDLKISSVIDKDILDENPLTIESITEEPIDSVEAIIEEPVKAEVETNTVVGNTYDTMKSYDNYDSKAKTEDTIPVTISYNLTEPSNLTAEQINLISAKVLEKYGISSDASAMSNIGDILYEVEHTYNINAFYMMAIMAHESWYGTSNAAINKNNLVGAMSSNGLRIYDSLDESINHFGDFLTRGYISQGRTTLSEISTKYCPSTSSDWTNKVSYMLNQYIETYESL